MLPCFLFPACASWNKRCLAIRTLFGLLLMLLDYSSSQAIWILFADQRPTLAPGLLFVLPMLYLFADVLTNGSARLMSRSQILLFARVIRRGTPDLRWIFWTWVSFCCIFLNRVRRFRLFAFDFPKSEFMIKSLVWSGICVNLFLMKSPNKSWWNPY